MAADHFDALILGVWNTLQAPTPQTNCNLTVKMRFDGFYTISDEERQNGRKLAVLWQFIVFYDFIGTFI